MTCVVLMINMNNGDYSYNDLKKIDILAQSLHRTPLLTCPHEFSNEWRI